MWLHDFLNSSVTYYGLDYIKRDNNTIVCGLNNREFPDMKVDVVFCSGVFEYIDEGNVNWFMEKVSETSPVLIMSCCTMTFSSLSAIIGSAIGKTLDKEGANHI